MSILSEGGRCRVFKISKRNGKFRTIYAPLRSYSAELNRIAGALHKKAQKLDSAGVVHGFMRGKNVVSNAMAHIGYGYTLSFDLADFFESVTPDKVAGKLSKEEAALVFEDGAARQGLPTSPTVANIAFAAADAAILKWIGDKQKVVYTRYADDLAFSFDDESLIDVIKAKVREIVGRAGFRINDAKTCLQSARGGRRVVTGVAVDEQGVHPTRASKRRLRAAVHQGKEDSARGLKEWCACKLPRTRPNAGACSEDAYRQLQALLKGAKLGSTKVPPEKPTNRLTDSVVISGDPVQMAGMSTWTTSWTSCMALQGGAHRRGVKMWLHLPGTRIAYLESGKTAIKWGVERPAMRARALVHTLKNGKLVHDRLYGESEAAKEELRLALEASGIVSVACRDEQHRKEISGVKVEGYAPLNTKPYFDSLKAEKVKLKSGRHAWKVFCP